MRHDESSVSGTTLDTPVSQEILDDWVIWMVLAVMVGTGLKSPEPENSVAPASGC